MKHKKHRALIIYHSCTGNTAKIAAEAAKGLEKNGWQTEKVTLAQAPGRLGQKPDFIVLGVPVHYWTVPAAAQEMLQGLPRLDGVPVFVFCAYGGCVYHDVTRLLGSALIAKGARIAGAAVVITPHSCPVGEGRRLGDVEERFGKGEPNKNTIRQFRGAVCAAARQSEDPSFALTTGMLKLSNAGIRARFMNKFLTLKMKASPMPGIVFKNELCTGCGKCIQMCSEGNFIKDGSAKVSMKINQCNKCYACAMNCRSGALSSDWKMIERLVRIMGGLSRESGTSIIMMD